MRVVLGQIIFNLLHHLEEVVEADEVWVLVTLRPDLHEELLGLFWVALETLHDCLQVFDINAATLLLVE